VSAPNLGTIVIYNGLPAVVCVTNASWTDALDPDHTDNPVAQPTVDQVAIFIFGCYDGYVTPAVVDIADLTYPAYQIQAV
jgi:hypothetical protein